MHHAFDIRALDGSISHACMLGSRSYALSPKPFSHTLVATEQLYSIVILTETLSLLELSFNSTIDKQKLLDIGHIPSFNSFRDLNFTIQWDLSTRKQSCYQSLQESPPCTVLSKEVVHNSQETRHSTKKEQGRCRPLFGFRKKLPLHHLVASNGVQSFHLLTLSSWNSQTIRLMLILGKNPPCLYQTLS